jgi:hypothetical protein
MTSGSLIAFAIAGIAMIPPGNAHGRKRAGTSPQLELSKPILPFISQHDIKYKARSDENEKRH